MGSASSASSAHRYFQRWVEEGVFHQLWKLGLLQAQRCEALDFSFMSIDGAMTKAPLGGEDTGANPTDRGKEGTKRHLLTEANGLPIGLVVTGANTHDIARIEVVLETMPCCHRIMIRMHRMAFVPIRVMKARR